ncbi:MAG: pentapeptide repeat-containing protein, partial [Candidatus Eiseniibacteriota bacterium]
RANLSGAHLSGATRSWAHLSRANLSGANLSGANLSGANLSGAANWDTYTKEVVPAILAAGGKPLADIVTLEHWRCHSWDNCPMAAAFGVKDIAEVPALHRSEAARFVELFDAKALPLEKVREWCGLPPLEDR